MAWPPSSVCTMASRLRSLQVARSSRSHGAYARGPRVSKGKLRTPPAPLPGPPHTELQLASVWSPPLHYVIYFNTADISPPFAVRRSSLSACRIGRITRGGAPHWMMLRLLRMGLLQAMGVVRAQVFRRMFNVLREGFFGEPRIHYPVFLSFLLLFKFGLLSSQRARFSRLF